MFCSNCGKQIDEGNGFCPYCGERQQHIQDEAGAKMKNTSHTYLSKAKDIATVCRDVTVLDVLIGVMYLIIAILWTSRALANIDDVWNYFQNESLDMRFIWVLAHLASYLIILVLCLTGILGIRKHKYYMVVSGIIAVAGLAVKVATFFLKDSMYDTIKYNLYRIFAVYGEIGIITIIFAIIAGALLYVKSNRRNTY